jgi:hypothetical protein
MSSVELRTGEPIEDRGSKPFTRSEIVLGAVIGSMVGEDDAVEAKSGQQKQRHKAKRKKGWKQR